MTAGERGDQPEQPAAGAPASVGIASKPLLGLGKEHLGMVLTLGYLDVT